MLTLNDDPSSLHQTERPTAIRDIAFELAPPEAFLTPAKRTGSASQFVRDMALIAAGWALLIGIVAHPEAQIVGLVATAIAMPFARG